MKNNYEAILDDAHNLLIKMADIRYFEIPSKQTQEYTEVYNKLNQFLKNNNISTGIR